MSGKLPKRPWVQAGEGMAWHIGQPEQKVYRAHEVCDFVSGKLPKQNTLGYFRSAVEHYMLEFVSCDIILGRSRAQHILYNKVSCVSGKLPKRPWIQAGESLGLQQWHQCVLRLAHIHCLLQM
jgi:hypothetical protein